MSNTLESQIQSLANEAEAQLDEGGDFIAIDRHHRLRSGSRLLLQVAAAVVVAAGITGLVLVARDGNLPDATSEAPSEAGLAGPPPIPENTPNVRVTENGSWLALDDLPPGFRFRSATDWGSQTGRGVPGWKEVQYEHANATTSVTVGQGAPPRFAVGDLTDSVVAASGTWTIGPISESGRDFGAVRGELVEQEGAMPSFEATVTASDITRELFVSLLDRVVSVPTSALPRAPLPASASDGAIVARAIQDGRTVLLRAITDGRSFVLSLSSADSLSGGSSQLGRNWIVVDGAAGPAPGLAADGDAETLVYGLAHPGVAEVTAELVDGTLIRSEPQDEHGFEENFFVVAVPTDTSGGLEQLSAIVAYDETGNELQRDGTYGT